MGVVHVRRPRIQANALKSGAATAGPPENDSLRVRALLKRRWKRVLGIAALAIVLGLGIGALALVIASPRLTPFLEGPKFRAELDRQTSKGLHFEGKYEPIERTGFATAWTAGFRAHDGVKAMRSLEADDVSAKFNPWGVLLRRWQLDWVHIRRGVVEVQTYEPKPDPPKSRPWYAIFLPDRVDLRKVTCDDADVTWRLRGETAGIFHTQVLITPYGRDFEYRANGGTLRSDGLAPEMAVRTLHLLITKTILEIYAFELGTKEGGRVAVTGKAGMRDDQHVDARLEFSNVALAPWLPDELRLGVSGRATGRMTWKGEAQTLEASAGEGELRVVDGRLNDLPLLDYLAAATRRRSLENVTLDRCTLKFRWRYPRFELTALDLGSEGKFTLRGAASVEKGGALAGTLELGMAPRFLDWLPRAREEIFTREAAGLIWTTVRLSGSLAKPENDLTPRLAKTLQKDPAAAAGLFFRGIGEWLEQKSRGH